MPYFSSCIFKVRVCVRVCVHVCVCLQVHTYDDRHMYAKVSVEFKYHLKICF